MSNSKKVTSSLPIKQKSKNSVNCVTIDIFPHVLQLRNNAVLPKIFLTIKDRQILKN